MLTNEQIITIAQKAAFVAQFMLGFSRRYSIALIDDPFIRRESQFDPVKNEILINLALLEPFSERAVPVDEEISAPFTVGDFPYQLKICYLVFREMRHMYQKEAVNLYLANKMAGSKKGPQLECNKISELWRKELQGERLSHVTDEDADAFAYYLSCRYPVMSPVERMNGRLTLMKAHYDMKPLPKVK